ncbi:hypothetical protein BXZ70DRAFT_500612 [Cristinia sonorae]|uniref:Uncharacterized protein n=1 Tax=Cristinia sonorae TaxID=1940300 RepID=A0A8K0UHG4_9AGAR|nr:hypothetical protein BXZ70DRAFT_500612 [Cristinia sonorae]
MVNWQSNEVMDICEFMFKQSLMLILGIYLWEFLLSFPKIDLLLLTRRIKFRWTLVPYLLGRYIVLVLLVFMAIYIHLASQVNCPVLARMSSVLGTMAVACASTNLMLRTFAIWRSHAVVWWLLIGVNATHWVVIFPAAFAPNTATNNPGHPGSCHFESKIILMFCLYTVATDFLSMVLTIVGLHRNGVFQLHSRTVWTTVYEQGIGYFVVALLVNMSTLILAGLDLNSVLNLITVTPAATFSVICSSRAVVSLTLQGTQRPGLLQPFSSYRLRPLVAEFHGPSVPSRMDTTVSPDQFTTDIHLSTLYNSTARVP